MTFRVLFKPIPETRTIGIPDPRILMSWLHAQAHPTPPLATFEERRNARWPSVDVAGAQVTTEAAALPVRWGNLDVRLYRPQGPGPLPVIVYFHGGGFCEGSLQTVENPCRLLALRAGALVVSVDYRLAPEHPFPAGLEDCFDAVKAVVEQAGSLGIDPSRLAVAGDSAGANLALGCSLLDRREGLRRIAAQLLVYPVVDLRLEGDHLPWSEDAYQVTQNPDLVWTAVRSLKDAGPFFHDTYLAGHPASDPMVSPLVHPQPSEFPPTLLVTAEFDFLRVEGEEFGRRLAEAGVPVRAVRYLGMDHGFFDRLGHCPQTADAVDEMAGFFRSVLNPRGTRLDDQLAFLLEIDKLKSVVRRNELADASRRENTAEHSWHLVMFALTLAEHGAPGVDVAHAVGLCAVHDLVEIDAGDTFFWDEKGYEDKEARERAAARRIFGLLPSDQAAQFLEWWEEFEAAQTPEALYANAVDRLAPVLLNSHSGGRSWRENGITAVKVRQKMTLVAHASPALGLALERLITAAEAKGFLAPEGAA